MPSLRGQRIASPNHGERGAGIDMLVLHYTAMADARDALARLTDPRAQVSSHYLVHCSGKVFELVPETRRAWHAGQSSWGGRRNLNSCSIGIEIDHPGHEGGNPGFCNAQIESLIGLCRDIVRRWPIPSHRILAHSDIAPQRKQDPGERFPWARLFRAGIGHWVEPARPNDAGDVLVHDETYALDLQSRLGQYGYEIERTGRLDEQTSIVIAAFQRHFRPERVDGKVDLSTDQTLARLLETLGPS
jgi:N-acetylmuramoyl-L-alanine amidase